MELRTARTRDLDAAGRDAVVRLCVEAHGEPDFERLFGFLPEHGLHVLAEADGVLAGHAVVTTRWLQPGALPLLRTAYVDAVAALPAGRGVGTAVLRRLAEEVAGDYEIACLETDREGFYARLGWEAWRGPLGGRSDAGLIPTPDQTGVMVLRLPRTPPLDLDAPLSVEAYATRIW